MATHTRPPLQSTPLVHGARQVAENGETEPVSTTQVSPLAHAGAQLVAQLEDDVMSSDAGAARSDVDLVAGESQAARASAQTRSQERIAR
jgi:hypothetical protein